MSMDDLTPLPEPYFTTTMRDLAHNKVPVFSAEQMRAYASAAVAAERERCADLCDELHRENHFWPPGLCADRIRGA